LGGVIPQNDPTNAETARQVGLADHLPYQLISPPIWPFLFPQKNAGVQVPPLKPPETLAVTTVPPFPRFLKSVTHWMMGNLVRERMTPLIPAIRLKMART